MMASASVSSAVDGVTALIVQLPLVLLVLPSLLALTRAVAAARRRAAKAPAA